MRRVILAGLVLALSAPAADAGPILDRLRARFGRPAACASGQCGSAAAFPAAVPLASGPAVGGCAGGVCYPATAFPVAFPVAGNCVNGVCYPAARR